MSTQYSELAFIFANVFDELFTYDEKYDELDFKKEITAQIVTDNINDRSKGLRDIWYRCYPVLMHHYKLYMVYDEEQLLNAIEYDGDYAFIPDTFVTRKMLNEHTFNKPIEQDYKFKQLTEQNDRDHFTLKYPVKYADGLNFDVYAERGLVNVNRLKPFLNDMNVKWTIKYLNDGGAVDAVIGRLYALPNHRECFEQLNESVKKTYADAIVECYENIRLYEVIRYCSTIMRRYKQFDFKDEDISCMVTDAMADMVKTAYNTAASIESGNPLESVLAALKESFNYCVQYSHSGEYLKLLLRYGTDKQRISACFTNCNATVDWIIQQYPSIKSPYVSECIKRGIAKREDIDRYIQRFSLNDDPFRFDIGFAWVEMFHEEPPLMFYPSPNYHESTSTDLPNARKPWQHGKTIADAWAAYNSDTTVPNEMTSMKYYDYMVKSNGVKRNPNQTIMYSYFSNSNENKLIFCRSDVELLDPAVPRFYIPVEFKKLKRYLHEDLLTTDICMFAQLTKNDWDKVALGKESIDVVAFNDMKNIYRERTPLRNVIKYLVDNIAIEFDVECQEAGIM